MTNINLSLNQKPTSRQTEQHILRSGQKVYLYGETKFSGRLLHPVERTYPPRWTVELDRGGYDSATVNNIMPLPSEESKIPCSDSTKSVEVEPNKDTRISELERENEILRTQLKQLQQENKTRARSPGSSFFLTLVTHNRGSIL